jgi:endonuclease G
VKLRSQGIINAWIERGALYQSGFTDHQFPETTLSIPGTADNVIAVAAINSRKPIQIDDHSSQGPTADGRQKPDVCAPGINVVAAKGGTQDETVAMTGTSMAAPHVTGAIALALSKRAAAGQTWPTVGQIASELRQTVDNYTGFWDKRKGYGRIDVAAFLARF